MATFRWASIHTLFALFISTSVYAQLDTIKITKIRAFGNAGVDKAQALRVDADSNLYITGLHSGSISWDGKTTTASPNQNAFYVTSFNKDLQARWATSGDSINSFSPAGGFGLDIDKNGHLLVAGGYSTTARLFGAANLYGARTSSLLKETGLPFFTRNFAKNVPLQVSATTITSDSDGNIYVAGYNGDNNGIGMPFIARLLPSTGLAVWIKDYAVGVTKAETSTPTGIIATQGRLFFSCYVGLKSLNGQALPSTVNIIELDPVAGGIVRFFETGQFISTQGGFTQGPDGLLYLHTQAAKLKVGLANGDTIPVSNGEQVIAGFSLDGKLRKLIRTYATGYIVSSSLAFAKNRLISAATFTSSFNSPLGPIALKGFRDIIVQIFDTASGNLVNQAQFGGNDDDGVGGLALMPNGDLALTGWFSDKSTFGAGQSLTSKGLMDIFLATFTIKSCTSLTPGTIAATKTSICADSAARLSFGTNVAAKLRWSTGDSTASIMINKPGTYKVTATNACSKISDSVVIKQIPTLVGTPIATTRVRLCKDSTARLSIATDPTATLLWSTGVATPSITAPAPGTYFVTASNACSSFKDSITIGAGAVPVFQPIPTDTLCQGSVLTHNFLVSQGTQVFVLPVGEPGSGVPTITVQGDTALRVASDPPIATQAAFAFTVFTQSTDGCPASTPYTAVVRPNLAGVISGVYTDSVCPDGSVKLDLRQTNLGNYALDANNPAGITESAPRLFTVQNLGLPERTVSYSLSATAPNYCSTKVRYKVTVANIPEQCTPLFVPNLVTANGDSHNDFLTIQGITPGTGKLSVFNSWGAAVLKDDAYANNWPDANTRPGVYFIRLEAPSRGQTTYTGWVEVQR